MLKLLCLSKLFPNCYLPTGWTKIVTVLIFSLTAKQFFKIRILHSSLHFNIVDYYIMHSTLAAVGQNVLVSYSAIIFKIMRQINCSFIHSNKSEHFCR